MDSICNQTTWSIWLRRETSQFRLFVSFYSSVISSEYQNQCLESLVSSSLLFFSVTNTVRSPPILMFDCVNLHDDRFLSQPLRFDRKINSFYSIVLNRVERFKPSPILRMPSIRIVLTMDARQLLIGKVWSTHSNRVYPIPMISRPRVPLIRKSE